VLHVRQRQAVYAPPPAAGTSPPVLTQLWERLTPGQRQQLCQVLSLLVARRLLPLPGKEVAHEPQ